MNDEILKAIKELHDAGETNFWMLMYFITGCTFILGFFLI
jgi:hypothetical protein